MVKVAVEEGVEKAVGAEKGVELSRCEATSKKSSLGNFMSGAGDVKLLLMSSVATGKEFMLKKSLCRERVG
jgi:hypothetical protein